MRRFISLIAAAATIASAACHKDAATGPAPTVVGNYTLQSANGHALPATVYTDPYVTVEIIGPSGLLMGADGTYRLYLSARQTYDGGVSTDSYTTKGTYLLSDRAITFIPDEGGPVMAATWDGDRAISLNVPDGSMSFVFKR